MRKSLTLFLFLSFISGYCAAATTSATESTSSPDSLRHYFIGAGVSGIRDTFGGNVLLLVEDIFPLTEFGLKVSGGFSHDENLAGANFRNHDHFSGLSEQLVGAYKIPLNPSKLHILVPSHLMVGSGIGLYHWKHRYTQWDTAGTKLIDDTRNHMYILPHVNIGVIWNLTAAEQIRVSGEYIFPIGPGAGINGYKVGGLGFSADIAIRFH